MRIWFLNIFAKVFQDLQFNRSLLWFFISEDFSLSSCILIYCWLLLFSVTSSYFLNILLWFIFFVNFMIILNYVSSKLTIRNIKRILIVFDFILSNFSPIISFILLSVQFSKVYLCSFLFFFIFWKWIKNALEYFWLFIVVIFMFFIVFCIFSSPS